MSLPRDPDRGQGHRQKGPSPTVYIEVLDIDRLRRLHGGVRRSVSGESPTLIAQVFSHVDDKTALALFGEVVE